VLSRDVKSRLLRLLHSRESISIRARFLLRDRKRDRDRDRQRERERERERGGGRILAARVRAKAEGWDVLSAKRLFSVDAADDGASPSSLVLILPRRKQG